MSPYRNYSPLPLSKPAVQEPNPVAALEGRVKLLEETVADLQAGMRRLRMSVRTPLARPALTPDGVMR